MRINLPQGIWITVRDVFADVSAEEVQAYFHGAGIELGLDQISLEPQNQGTYAGVIVSLSRLDVLDLVERATHESKLRGRPLTFMIPGQR